MGGGKIVTDRILDLSGLCVKAKSDYNIQSGNDASNI